MRLGILVILFWLIIIGLLVYFIIRWAQGEAVINNQASGISSIERDDDTEEATNRKIPRMAGIPRAYEPQEDIHEVAAHMREQVQEDSTQDTPVYLGDNSSVVSVHLK
ncbi:hypothetical protein EJ419_04205 [Alloscardovia theropitheci]|uniref:Uncharacterized protein n=1 Tax=Alloscardovia theropitheci TaxID=2496842 RepID=A0A4R0QS70_9BIFI|nr:hypothetical protein [Alloscardovia theropitheci]TCD54248.1 hypothetical protein EJ419_04205 [Alloscardovia theropitheci]